MSYIPKYDSPIEIFDDIITSIPDLSEEDLSTFSNYFYQLNDLDQKAFLKKVNKSEIIDLIINCIKNKNYLNILTRYLVTDKHLENYQYNDDIHGYYFLFKKNLGTTNIQFSELIALIRKYATINGDNIGNELIFLHIKELKELIDGFYSSIYQLLDIKKFQNIANKCRNFWELLYCLLMESDESSSKTYSIMYDPIELLKVITEKYNGLIMRTVIIDCFYSSCIIYLPKSMTLDLKNICAYSGYINSCGNLIYIKNVEKANKENFLSNIYAYDNSIDYKSKFAVFSHEDSNKILNTVDEKNPFSDIIKEELKSGLNNVKVYLEKFYMGDKSLINVINTLRKDSQENKIKLIVPDIDDLQWRINESSEFHNTMWFHIEHSISEFEPTKPGKLRYYICYEQLFKNDNQLHIFDENKPAWKSSTTIPQTLVGAMFNIALQYVPSSKNSINVLDPFLGTGTTLLESLKYENINFKGFDEDKLSPILIEDNFNIIFKRGFQDIISNFDFHIEQDKNQVLLNRLMKKFKINFSAHQKGEYDIPNELISDFKENHIDRILLYLLFKANIKNSGALVRHSENPIDTTNTQKKLLNKESFLFLAQLLELKSLITNTKDEKNNAISYKQGKFSTKLFLNSAFIENKFNILKANNAFESLDIRDFSNKKNTVKYDIIITDPPYGFNVSHQNLDLAGLFNDLVGIFLENLNDYGQILIALPEKSYSGKRSPYFTHKEIVVKNFILQAPKFDFEVINSAEILPKINLFRPPYYWEAEKALRRSIIHLRFRRLKSVNENIV